ncbi:MAG: HAMP domain-containing protein [Proteobacteria bacterium]|nr:HAMP domain-containing protein [Pseudomonadota bacterium]
MAERDRPIGAEGEETPRARLAAPPLAPSRWGVAAKLRLTFGILIGVFAVSGVISFQSIQRIDNDLRQIVEIKEPLERAVLEMEINAGETARAVLRYVRELETEHLAVMRDAEADFERYAQRFERLAETGEARRLGRKVAGLYAAFKTLGDEIVVLADQQKFALQAFRTATEAVDDLVDGKLRPLAGGNTRSGTAKLKAAADLDEFIDETFPPMEAYLVHRDPALRQAFQGAQAEFDERLARYRQSGLSAEEEGLLNRIERAFHDAMETGIGIMAIMDRLDLRLDDLEEQLMALDSALDDEIQPLIHAETVKAAEHAQASTDSAIVLLAALGAGAILFAVFSAWAISRGVLGPVRALVRGADIVGGGSLTHRIDITSKDEFGHLASAFNRMVENLARALQSVEDARGRLERRVEERTRDLEHELDERERAESALTESEARFRDFGESASDWFWEMDADLRFTFLSDHFFGLFHIRPEDVIGKTRKDFATKDQIVADKEKWRRHFADLAAHRPIRDFEYSIVGGDGVKRYISLSCVPVFDDAGTFRGYRGSGSNITGRMLAEEALRESREALQGRVADLEEAQLKLERQGSDLVRLADDLKLARDEAENANRSKSEFLANMSHELRTPLNAIMGFSEIIEKQIHGPVGSDKYRDYAIDINGAGRHLLDLINDILDLSKIESGKAELHEEDIDVAALLGSVQTLVRSHAHDDDIALEFDTAEGLPALRADARKLKQILVNLLSNAIKFTKAGGKVALRAWCREDSGYVFQIADSGIGIAFEDIPKALAPFHQIDSALNRKYEGTGLGLPLTKSLVELHGGSLDLQSEVGKGTTVTVRFPANRIVAAAGTQSPAAPAHGVAIA